MSSSDDQIRSAIEVNEHLAEWGAWGVVIGLLLEVGLASGKSLGILDDPHAENWGAVLADSLIALGVLAEIRFGRKANEGNKELRARAEARASEADRALERLRIEVAPRRISLDQFQEIFTMLHGQSHMLMRLEFPAGDGEANLFAIDIRKMLVQCGMVVTSTAVVSPSIGFGLLIHPATGGDGTRAKLLIDAFAAAGLTVETGESRPRLTLMVGHRPSAF